MVLAMTNSSLVDLKVSDHCNQEGRFSRLMVGCSESRVCSNVFSVTTFDCEGNRVMESFSRVFFVGAERLLLTEGLELRGCVDPGRSASPMPWELVWWGESPVDSSLPWLFPWESLDTGSWGGPPINPSLGLCGWVDRIESPTEPPLLGFIFGRLRIFHCPVHVGRKGVLVLIPSLWHYDGLSIWHDEMSFRHLFCTLYRAPWGTSGETICWGFLCLAGRSANWSLSLSTGLENLGTQIQWVGFRTSEFGRSRPGWIGTFDYFLLFIWGRDASILFLLVFLPIQLEGTLNTLEALAVFWF